jgi:hypothetical protein
MAKDYSKIVCNIFTFYFMYEIYIFTKNGQIPASLHFSAQLDLAQKISAKNDITLLTYKSFKNIKIRFYLQYFSTCASSNVEYLPLIM